MTFGISWGGQLTASLIACGFGLLGGFPALLFFRKSGKLEQVLTDIFACACLIMLYLLSVELGSRGQLTWYTPLCFLAGTVVIIKLKKPILRLAAKVKGLFLALRAHNSGSGKTAK